MNSLAWTKTRESDSFGLAYFFYDTSDEISLVLVGALGGIGDSQGVEAFYSIQTTKTLTITPDFQWISQARQSDDAFLLGIRANVAF